MECSSCLKNLDESQTGCMDWILRLSAIEIKPCGPTFDLFVYPPIEKSHYFCGMGCLHKWVKEKYGSTGNI